MSYLERVPNFELQPFWAKCDNFVTQRDAVPRMPQVLSSSGPLITDHYTQFRYTRPMTLRLVTNVYGLTVSSPDDWRNPRSIGRLSELSQDHRVRLLVPAVAFWWHEPSRATMLAVLERIFGNDVPTLTSTRNLLAALARHGIRRCDWGEMIERSRAKYANESVDDGKPGVFAVRLYHENGALRPNLARYGCSGRARACTWSRLIPPKFQHAHVTLSINGVTISKHGVSLDAWLVRLGVEEMLRRHLPPRSLDSDDDTRSEDE